MRLDQALVESRHLRFANRFAPRDNLPQLSFPRGKLENTGDYFR